MQLSINELIKDIRESSDAKRRKELLEEPAPYIPIGKAAWRRRELKEERKVREEENAVLDKEHRRAVAQSKYYRKNAKELNRKRRIRSRLPKEVYAKARRRAIRKGQDWGFSFDTWWELWDSRELVEDEDSSFFVKAWKVKGSNPATHAQMWRRDPEKGWNPDNCFIAYRGEELNPREAPKIPKESRISYKGTELKKNGN